MHKCSLDGCGGKERGAARPNADGQAWACRFTHITRKTHLRICVCGCLEKVSPRSGGGVPVGEHAEGAAVSDDDARRRQDHGPRNRRLPVPAPDIARTHARTHTHTQPAALRPNPPRKRGCHALKLAVSHIKPFQPMRYNP